MDIRSYHLTSNYNYTFKEFSAIHYLAAYCINILNFTSNTDFLKEGNAYYELLFSNNKNLKSVTLIKSKINGICLKHLSSDTLDTLILKYCNIFPLVNLTIHFKNLKIFKILLKKYTDYLVQLQNDKNKTLSIIAPKINDYVNLSKNLEDKFNTSTLLLESNNLKSLILNDFTINNEISIKLSSQPIETFILVHCTISSNNLLKCITNLKKLTLLGLQLMTITELMTKAIVDCQNLRILLLSSSNLSNISLASVQKLFQSLCKLEVIDLSYCEIDDNFLWIIRSNCKNLKSINLNICFKITDIGLSHITSLPKLEKLFIYGASNVTDSSIKFMSNIKELKCGNIKDFKKEGLCNLLRTSPYLQKLDIRKCKEDVITDVLSAAIETENVRGNNVNLSIFLDNPEEPDKSHEIQIEFTRIWLYVIIRFIKITFFHYKE